MTTSVIVITLNRPNYLRDCLKCLYAQECKPDQIIVVDSSRDNQTREVAERFTDLVYLRNEKGFGYRIHSRNIGLVRATGDIIAFLDDDAFASPKWLANILSTYTDPSIGGVGGRTLNNQPGEEILGLNEIGRLKANGFLTGYFAADPGKTIEVDHIIGANMSFRREVLAQLGGFCEEGYVGSASLGEETDMCLRVKRLGYRILFNPSAVVSHQGAPLMRGKRFDYKYSFYAERNMYVLLIKNYGIFAPIIWRYLLSTIAQNTCKFVWKTISAFTHYVANMLGALIGIVAGTILWFRSKGDPVRHDKEGVEIRNILGKTSGQE